MRKVSVFGPVAAGLLLCSLVHPALATSVACTPPGLVVTTDPAGDSTPNGSSPAGPTPVGESFPGDVYDILSVSIAEPAHRAGKRLLAITLQVSSLKSLPSSSYWWVHLLAGGTDNFVSMRIPDPSSTSQAPIFQSGTVATTGFTLGGPIEPESSYDADKGTITYIVSLAQVGVGGDGFKIDSVTAEAGTFGSAGSQPVATNPWDDTGNGQVGSYTLGRDGTCGLLAASPPQRAFSGISPRYQVYTPDGIAPQSSGEFNIGFNPKTGRIMAMSDTITYRITPPQLLTPELPESCDASWEDVSPLIADAQSLDPILVTDQGSGRTFISNQTTGANALFAHTDDDGANWIQAAVGPPNGSSDHETIATGPYPAGSPFASVAQAAGVNYAVYYCAQATVPAFCQRSDDGGLSFGNGVPIYNGVTTECSSIHGHAKVSPDGTVYVPNARRCGTHQGGAVSTDAGQSWSDFIVPTATTPSGGFDPSIGIASDNTVYYCSANADGHPHVAVSKDHGATWTNDYDIGASLGIQNAVFVQAVAGDPDRAACGFLGTNKAGNYDGLDFDGVWYLYVATTYDGGKTWTTVNATPGDPVQGAGGICSQGTFCNSSPNNRNLDDFNEVTVDDQGRVLFGYDDGCTSDTCIQHPENHNDFNASVRVARQSGGRGLYAKFDRPEPTRPMNACLSGQRDSTGAHLKWKAPDNRGAGISGYNVFRAASAGGPFVKIGATGPRTTFDDATADKNTADFFYRVTALNSAGEGDVSNVADIKLGPDPVVQSSCKMPGLQVVTSPPGTAYDEALPTGQDDLLAVYFAEPSDQPGKLVITMKVNNLNPTPPPQGRWIVYLKLPTSADLYWVAMSTADGPLPAFNYGTKGSMPIGPEVFGTFNTLGMIDGTWNADGTIQFVIDTNSAPFVLKAGDAIKQIAGEIRQTSTPSALNNMGFVADSATGSDYTVVKNRCSAASARVGQDGTSNGVVLGSGSLGLFTLLPLFAAGLARRRKR